MWVALGAAILIACGPSVEGSDGGARDAGSKDGGARDGGARDAGDGPMDGSNPPTDSGAPTDAASVTDAATSDAGSAAITLPPANAGLDYQLGGAYPPPSGVGIVSRDRHAAPAPGLYNICYVNGFQIQPDEEAFWMTDHPDLILRDSGGDPVIDTDWDEMLIDVSTPEKRAAVAAIVGDWIAGCTADGFDAVEIDNLDSYSRSTGLLTMDDAVAAVRLFADAAHAHGLAIAQKNSSELVDRRADMGTDFVVAEECNRYSECDVYTGAYGDHVLVIEYRQSDFDTGCSAYPELSIVLRDRNLVTPSGSGYVYDGC